MEMIYMARETWDVQNHFAHPTVTVSLLRLPLHSQARWCVGKIWDIERDIERPKRTEWEDWILVG